MSGSKLRRTNIQSSQLVDAKCVELADGTEGVLCYMPMPKSRHQLFKLKNVAAEGAILTSFKITGFTKLADGTELAIDGAGNLVTADSIDEATGLGTALTADQIEAAPKTLVKELIGNCGQTATNEEADPLQLKGDTGAVGNSYVLETHKQEYGFQAEENCQDKPCFICLSATVAGGGGMFALAMVQTCLDFAIPVVTKEIVA